MKKFLLGAVCLALLAGCHMGQPDQTSAVLYKTTDKGNGDAMGQVVFTDMGEGVRIEVTLAGLARNSEHGFHVHEHGDCSPVKKDGKIEHAMAAGGHYDPDHTGKHLGPEGGGHKGDLPRLKADENGYVKESFYVKHLRADELKNRAIMVHAGGDNYSDTPAPLGGGGARIACGVIK